MLHILPEFPYTMKQPEAYIHSVGKLFNAEGKLSDPDTRAFLTDFMQKFADWVENISQHD
jgi:chromate reductase